MFDIRYRTLPRFQMCVRDRQKAVHHSSWCNYHGCSLIGRVNDQERADESNVQGECNGVPGRREQPNQWLRTYDRFQHSNRPDLQKKQRKKSSIVGTTIEPLAAKQPSSSNEFQNSKLTQISPLTLM
jgi:hypothetical protein